ncbi:tetratricopeptide repeat protein [uncultured Dokdonia sp.]|uniref:tetratricopeptide repeat protein n=1 Tax=uncultured Dokdonia sp. TaxID=575653 RepID=UPI002617693A|nr:tetratricopeptide repeat protein [uncultured Dokdonia sp.]
MIEPLSSFAISIAAGVALEIYPAMKNFRKQGIDKQIKLAFNTALKDWSLNKDVRTQKERELKSLLQSHIEERDILTTKIVNKETLDFLKHFEKRLAEHTQAYDYLKAIIDKQRHDAIILELSTIKEQPSEIQEEIKKGNIDARDVGDWLDKIDFEEGKEKVEAILQNWYSERAIDSELKEVLLLAVKKIFERTDELTQEIKELKSQGDTYLAGVLEQIKKAIEQRKPDALTAIYDAYLQKEKEKRVQLLQELIDSATALFAYEEAKQFYSDLIELEPSAKNYFKFAYFLTDFHFYDESIIEFKKALKLYKKYSEEFPSKYLPIIAITVHCIANLHAQRKEDVLALKNYKKVVEIYKDLSSVNSDLYIDKVIGALSNLANFYVNKNNYSIAITIYEEGLQICKTSSIENSESAILMLANLANVYWRIENRYLALKSYEKALKINKKLTKDNPSIYLSDLKSSILNNIGLLYAEKNEYSLGLKKCLKALKIRRELVEENPNRYLPYLARQLKRLADLYFNNDNYSSALILYLEILEIYRGLAKKNPRRYLGFVAYSLSDLATIYKNNEQQLAIDKYEKALDILRGLVNQGFRIYLPKIADVVFELAVLYSEKNENYLTLEYYKESLGIYRKLSIENTQKYRYSIAMILHNMIYIYDSIDESGLAIEKYEESVIVFKNLAQESSETYDVTYSKILIIGAYLSEKNNKNLNIAKELLLKYPDVPQAQQFLQWIDDLEKDKSP